LGTNSPSFSCYTFFHSEGRNTSKHANFTVVFPKISYLVSYNHLCYIKPHACQHKGQKDALLHLRTMMWLMMECACMWCASLCSSESRIFWSRIGVNCDHFQNIFWKWSKYIDIKLEYGISTHQINDYNYFNIFNFFIFFSTFVWQFTNYIVQFFHNIVFLL
jgi:hypothetical protein